jgi:hypothetical protein
MMTLRSILERGYFPKELPDPFVTTSFAAATTPPNATLPSALNTSLPQGHGTLPTAKATRYSHARGGLLRRQLSMPNPIHYYLLARELDSNWSGLQPYIGGTALSATNPVMAATGRAIQGAQPQDARRQLAVQTRLNNRYILRTDITRFYHSIYTHSIPWALHTKSVAKSNRSMSLLGNRLDYLLRSEQDGQTVGIPIGPDASLVIAEVLMQACDKEILSGNPSIRGHRFIDDYELGFRHRTDAEATYHILERILTDYELALNPKKTEVFELPCTIEALWVDRLRSFTFKTTPAAQMNDLLRFFDLAFELSGEFPDEAVLQYAVGRLRNLMVDPSNWDLFQKLLLDCATPEPASLPYVLELIIKRVITGAQPAVGLIGEVLNSLIVDHSTLAHSSEVAWSLWACLALGINVSAAAVRALSSCDDSVVALLALHCEAQGLLSAALNKTLWSRCMNTQGLYEEHWLLSYEANVKGWLPSQGSNDHVAADPTFGFLKAAGVSFYDMAMAAPSPGAPPPIPHPPTPPTEPDISP